MTSKEFASEKKFIYVAKYYGKCQVRKDETPVAEYYQNPYNPNDRRIRIERKQEIIPQFIITRPTQESTFLSSQLQGEKEDFAADYYINTQSNNNQKSDKTEASTQDQDKKQANDDLRSYITKLEEKIEFLTNQVRDLQSLNKNLEIDLQQSKPNCYDKDNPSISQLFQNNASTLNINPDNNFAIYQHADQFKANQDQSTISDNRRSQLVPKIQSSNEGNNKYQYLQQYQQTQFQYSYPQPSQQQIINNSVQIRVDNHTPIPLIETSPNQQIVLQKMGQSSQQYFVSHPFQIFQPFNSLLTQQQIPLQISCGIQDVRTSQLPSNQILPIEQMGNLFQNQFLSRVPNRNQSNQQIIFYQKD
eukprot:403354028